MSTVDPTHQAAMQAQKVVGKVVEAGQSIIMHLLTFFKC